MRLVSVKINNFRNLGSVAFQPSAGVNVIYGENAQGKTNLIEAVYLLTGQKSFRQAREPDFVRFGADVARIEADFECQGRTKYAALAWGSKKTAWLGGVECQPSALTGEFLAVVFSPGELSLVQDGPAERRAFLDGAISQVMPRYLSTINTLGRVLAQRNTLINDMVRAGFPEAMEPLLETWDVNLARCAYSVFHARARFIHRLEAPAAEIYRDLCQKAEPMTLCYQPGIAPPAGADWAEVSPAEGEARILAALREARSEDRKNYCTTLGPHRDNMDVLLGGISARSFGSQGQQRSCALALKLAQCRVMEETLGEAPIILLDDVLSELDRTRRDYFLKGGHRGQVFITCCERGAVRSLAGGAAWRMKNGILLPSRRKQKTTE